MLSMVSPELTQALSKKFELLQSEFDERSRRLWAATEAIAIGHGGVKTVARATGIAESTIRIGKKELKQGAITTKTPEIVPRRIRRKGAGRKSLTTQDDSLVSALDSLVEPTARGDPMCPLRWTCKSTRKLAQELRHQGHRISHTKVSQLLRSMGLQPSGHAEDQRRLFPS